VSFFDELKRRRVVRVALVYLVVAWAIIQVADTVAPRIGLPTWTVTMVIMLAGLGFPVALVFAWIFDITPQGIERTSHISVEASNRKALGYLGVGILIALVGFAAYSSFGAPRDTTSKASASSVAVLPFVDLSPLKDQEYLSDGITEIVMNELGEISGLRVAGRSSAFSFKGKNVPVVDIGRQLNVGTVLEGSVQRVGDRLRVTVSLSNATTGSRTWSEKFDRDAKDIFAVEDEIARAIADALRVTLAPSQIANADVKLDPRAHDLYLQGLYYFNKRGGDNLRKAIAFFEQSIVVDSMYAAAWAGLASAASVLPTWDFSVKPEAVSSKAKAAAQKALTLDRSSYQALAALGNLVFMFDWDYPGGERYLRQALRLNPNDANSHHWYSELLNAAGRFDEALAEKKRAAELEPLSANIRLNLGNTYYYRREYDAALAECERSLELDPKLTYGYQCVAGVHMVRGEVDPAIRAWLRYAEETGARNPDAYRELARRITLREPLGSAARAFEDPAFIRDLGDGAMVSSYAWTGDSKRALDIMERMVEQKTAYVFMLARDPLMEPLYGNARFIALVKRMNLEPSVVRQH
jgi:adenylate cyclase